MVGRLEPGGAPCWLAPAPVPLWERVSRRPGSTTLSGSAHLRLDGGGPVILIEGDILEIKKAWPRRGSGPESDSLQRNLTSAS